MVWFGLISFPLYLWHWPLLSFARIIESETPSREIRIALLALSILLAWLTFQLIEKPFRFGQKLNGIKVKALCLLVLITVTFGLIVSKVGFSESHGYENLLIKRRGFEHAFGSSLLWYRGKNDWLFLGNQYENNVAKLKLAIIPDEDQINSTKADFEKISTIAAEYNTQVVLIVGPDKSSIYKEYLPDGLIPSSKKYLSFFLDKLSEVKNLTIYDPTNDLISFKHSEGILYWMTDTHWNSKGAFLTYFGFSKLLDLPVPRVNFKQGSQHRGDLIEIAKLQNFPLHAEDNWDIVWPENLVLHENVVKNEQKTSFGSATVFTNENPLSNKYIWVVGDSFASALKPYFNATFKEVRYVGHWADKLNSLPQEFSEAARKPDMIVIVRVERTF